MKLRSVVLACFMAGMALVTAHAQDYLYATGSPTFSTQLPIDHGFVQVNNGEIHLEIPLPSAPQRGDFASDQKLVYDSRIWKIIQSGGGYTWSPTNVPASAGGWTFQSGQGGGTITMITGRGSDPHTFPCGGGPSPPPRQSHPYTDYYGWTWTDPNGTSHPFPDAVTFAYDPSNQECTPPQTLPDAPTASALASDGSGYSLSISNYTTATITDLKGKTYHPGSPVVTDRNGNSVSADGSGNFVDTSGRAPILISSSGNNTFYDVYGGAGSRLRYTVTYVSVPYSTQFNETAVGEVSGSFSAIQSIGLPDGSSYRFTYNTGTYGDLASMTLPTGGVITYNYLVFHDSFNNQNHWLSSIVKDGGTTSFTPGTISLCSGSAGCQESVTVVSPDANDTAYVFTLDKTGLIAGSSWKALEAIYQGHGTNGHIIRRTTTSYAYNTRNVYFYQNGSFVTRGTAENVASTTNTVELPEAGISSQTITAFAPSVALPADVKVSDWYATSQSPPSAPATETFYTYGSTPYGAVGLPASVTVKDGSGIQLAATTYTYDESTPSPSPTTPPQHTLGINSGNLTTKSDWVNTSNKFLSTKLTYYDTGVVKSMTDPSGGTTSYGYDTSGTYVTSTTLPSPSGISLTTSATTDPYAGVPLSSTDLNGTTTTTYNYDGLNRPGEVDVSDSAGHLVGKTTFQYTSTTTATQVYQSGSVNTSKVLQLDSYGRPSRLAIASGRSSNPWNQQDTCYDANGRVRFSSYSYSGPGFGAGIVCSGAGDAITYDALGRAAMVNSPDGTTQIAWYGPASRITDKNGLQKITREDAFGRLTAICEVSSNSSMPQSGTPTGCSPYFAGSGFLTTYSYSYPGFSTTVNQGAQTRVFQSDSLGRQVSVQEPERGTTTFTYAYNPTGLAVTRMRPAANQPVPSSATTQTVSQYDTLNRLLSVSYSDGTPTKAFSYDQLPSGSSIPNLNVKGLLTGMNAGGTSGTSYGYDARGRVNQTISCLPDWCGQSAHDVYRSFAYDWTGNLTADRYATYGNAGAFQTVTFGYNIANQLTSIGGGQNDAASPFIYTAAPATMLPTGPQTETYGNGLIASSTYDGVGRLQGRWLCGGTGGVNCPGGPYYYGMVAQTAGNQVQSVVDTVLNRFTDFSYDDMGRLTGSTTHPQSGYTGLAMSATYDRYGNRWSESVTNTGGNAPNLSFSYNAQNQIVGSGYIYDVAGNLINDGVNQYKFDAENNLVAISGASTATYVYDALNRRVKASVGGVTDRYGLDLAGRRSTTWLDGNLTLKLAQYYAGAAPVAFWSAADGHIHFEHQDYLGTERMRTGYNGAQEATTSSLPYGEIASSTGTDLAPGHFALLDQDLGASAGLAHATFREYSTVEGRWTSADPYDGSYDESDPQSYNRYTYSRNNPLGLTDPSGQDPCAAAEGLGSLAGPGGAAAGAAVCVVELAYNLYRTIDQLIGLFQGPSFQGTTKPRPNTQPWDEYHIHYYGNIAGALGLPDQGCEFGACGGVGSDFQNAATMTLPALGGAAACAAAEPCGAIAIGVAAAGAVGTAIYMGRKQVNEKVDEARRVAPLDPCGYLKNQLAGASTVDKLKINTALKFLGCKNVGKDRGGPNK